MGVKPGDLSFIRNSKDFNKISVSSWRVFRDVANRKIYIEGHTLKDVRNGVRIVNLLEYPAKRAIGARAARIREDMNKKKPAPATKEAPAEGESIVAEKEVISSVGDTPKTKIVHDGHSVEKMQLVELSDLIGQMMRSELSALYNRLDDINKKLEILISEPQRGEVIIHAKAK